MKDLDFIISHIKTEYFEYIEGLPDEQIKEMTLNGIKKASLYNFIELENVLIFVVWMFIMAPNFDTQKEIFDILKNKSASANERIENILHDSFNDAWQEAQDNYDGDAWFPELKK